MNKIEGLLDRSEYEGYWDFINYRVDGYWLDERLDEIYPGKELRGLIPTLVYWMERDDEKAVVWNRILPEENQTSICPILMCPDDNDFSCTLVVAEIKNCGQTVVWKQMGLDNTREWEAEKVGSIVKWFDELRELSFLKVDYLAMLDSFRERLDIDKEKLGY
jgi:hypothetical protein